VQRKKAETGFMDPHGTMLKIWFTGDHSRSSKLVLSKYYVREKLTGAFAGLIKGTREKKEQLSSKWRPSFQPPKVIKKSD